MSIKGKSKMNRWLILGLALLLTFSLAACSSSTGSSNTKQNSAGGETQKESGNNTAESSATNKEDKAPLKVTLAGGSVGGFWSGLGQAVGQTFSTSYPGSSFSYEPGSGAGNVKLVAENQVELGIAQAVEVIAAQKGIEPFTQKYEGLTALATLYDNAVLQISVRKEFLEKHGITSLEDIVTKKVPINIGINQKGNLNILPALTVLESYGITEEAVTSWGGSYMWKGSKSRFEAMQNGKLDMSIDFTFAPEAKILETSIHTPLTLLGINDAAVAKVNEEWGLKKATIPAGSYDWQKEDIQTVSLSAVIMASKKASEQDLYKMAKAIVENIELLKAVHPAMKDITPEKLADTGGLPLAPGAKDYFKEIGAVK
jgi:TRAP transporter TAXI family solute receptor